MRKSLVIALALVMVFAFGIGVSAATVGDQVPYSDYATELSSATSDSGIALSNGKIEYTSSHVLKYHADPGATGDWLTLKAGADEYAPNASSPYAGKTVSPNATITVGDQVYNWYDLLVDAENSHDVKVWVPLAASAKVDVVIDWGVDGAAKTTISYAVDRYAKAQYASKITGVTKVNIPTRDALATYLNAHGSLTPAAAVAAADSIIAALTKCNEALGEMNVVNNELIYVNFDETKMREALAGLQELQGITPNPSSSVLPIPVLIQYDKKQVPAGDAEFLSLFGDYANGATMFILECDTTAGTGYTDEVSSTAVVTDTEKYSSALQLDTDIWFNPRTITFDSNGGSAVAPLTVPYSYAPNAWYGLTDINVDVTSYKKGYSFEGWYTGIHRLDGGLNLTENKAVKAEYEALPPVTTIAFGGDGISNTVDNADSFITSSPMKDGVITITLDNSVYEVQVDENGQQLRKLGGSLPITDAGTTLYAATSDGRIRAQIANGQFSLLTSGVPGKTIDENIVDLLQKENAITFRVFQAGGTNVTEEAIPTMGELDTFTYPVSEEYSEFTLKFVVANNDMPAYTLTKAELGAVPTDTAMGAAEYYRITQNNGSLWSNYAPAKTFTTQDFTDLRSNVDGVSVSFENDQIVVTKPVKEAQTADVITEFNWIPLVLTNAGTDAYQDGKIYIKAADSATGQPVDVLYVASPGKTKWGATDAKQELVMIDGSVEKQTITLYNGQLLPKTYEVVVQEGETPEPKPIYADLDMDEWYYEAIVWATDEGITNGVGSNADGEPLFGLGQTMSRIQFVTMLGRYFDIDVSQYDDDATPFSDVDPTDAAQTYAIPYINWGYEVGILEGIGPDANGNPQLNPYGAIIRQDAATMYYRYLKSIGEGFGDDWSFQLPAFTDIADLQDYALEAVSFMVMNELMVGHGDGTFGFNENLLREQGMQLMYNIAHAE